MTHKVRHWRRSYPCDHVDSRLEEAVRSAIKCQGTNDPMWTEAAHIMASRIDAKNVQNYEGYMYQLVKEGK
jgi:hypothetical protein